MRRRWIQVGSAVGIVALAGGLIALVALTAPTVGPGAAAQAVASPTASAAAMTTAAGLYQDFVTKLAANLGISDPVKVNAAIKTTLDQMVDEQQAAGHLKARAANTLKQRIDRGAFERVFATLFKKAATAAKHPAHRAPAATPTPAGTPAV